MNLHHLKIFFCIAKYGSITKAAKMLGLSQPAVSLQIQDLQNKYNFKLFDIIEKKIFLTPIGKEIFDRCSIIFDIENQIDLLIEDYQNLKNGLLTLFSTSSFTYFYLPAIITQFKKKLPEIVTHTYTYNSAKIIKKTLNSINDIGFIGYKIEHPNLIVKELVRENLFVICHPEHALSKKYVIMPNDLEGHNFITTEKNAGTRRAIDKYIEENNIKLNIIAEFDSLISIIEMVKQNHGISIVAKRITEEYIKRKEIVGIPIHGGCFRYFYIIYHREKYISEIVKKFLEETELWCKKYNSENLKEITRIP
jgi:DNA-binding transcriptional LysR family regulator